MSYYDFDEHFWSPKTVCVQCKQPSSQDKTTNRTVLTILSILSIAITSGISWTILETLTSNNSDKMLRKNHSYSSNCLLLQGNAKMQVYCSQSK